MRPSGLGVRRIVERLHEAGLPGPACRAVEVWRRQAFGRERKYLGKWLGPKSLRRRHGFAWDTHQRIVRALTRDHWHIRESPELRIVDEDLWRRVRCDAPESRGRRSRCRQRRGRRTLMRGRNPGRFIQVYLFVGFLRCGTCGGSVTTLYGRPGEGRCGCSRSHKNGRSACENRLTVRASIV